MSKTVTIANLKKAMEVLTSSHVSKVEVSFEYEADGARYYSAITRKGFEQHLYSVRAAEDSDGTRFVKCNCPAAAQDMLCRHAIKTAEVDSELFGKPINTETLATYNAYKHYEKRKAA